MTLRAILAAALTCVASPASAQEMFAGYEGFCGLPVIVGADPQYASARIDARGQKYIHVDPGVMGNWTTSRIFALAHECAHHLLGHTSSLGAQQRFMGGTRRQELEADCWAAQALARLGEYDDLTRVAISRTSEGHFAGGGYPSGIERARAIEQCVGEGRGGGGERRCNYERCQHPAHPDGDPYPCTHQAHPNGDVYACQHACPGPYGLVPCHPAGDLAPCQHAAHFRGDLSPCSHPAHPQGHQVCE